MSTEDRTKEVFRSVNLDDIIKAYQDIVSRPEFHGTDHPLFVKGIFAGMEIMASAQSHNLKADERTASIQSARKRKKQKGTKRPR